MCSGVSLLAWRNIKPIKYFERLVHVRLLDDASREGDRLAMEVLQGIGSRVAQLFQGPRDSGFMAAKHLRDFDLAFPGAMEAVEHELVRLIQTA